MALFGLFGRSKLSLVEGQVLGAVAAELSPAAREIFNQQRDLVNLIQRHADGKEVNLYVMRRGKPFVEEQFLFPLRVTETELATVEMIEADEQKSLRAAVWLVEGRVFSIAFNKPPPRNGEKGVEIKRVKILCDPMVPESKGTASDAQRREKILETVQAKLPDEYLQLVGEGKGVSINEWTVYAVQDIRKIPQRDGNYCLLAEKQDLGALGVKEDESSGQLYYLDYGEDHGEKITVGFRTFLEEFDGGKVAGRF
jgi:hypothetical protein